MPPKKKRARSAKNCRRPSCRTRPRGPRREGTQPPAPRPAAPPPPRNSGAPILVRTAGGRTATVIEKKQRGWFVCDLDGNANEEGKAHERKTLRRPHGFAPGQDHLLDSAPQAPIVPKPKGEGPRKKKPKSQAGPGPVPPGAVRARTAGGRVATVLYRKQRGWFAVELDGDENDEGRRVRAKTLRRPMFAAGQDELLNSAPPDPNPAEPKPKDPAAPKKSPAKAAAAAPADKDAKRRPPSRPCASGPSARPLSSSSVPVAAVIPADTPQGLAACFAAFYPGSKAEDKAKFHSSCSTTPLCSGVTCSTCPWRARVHAPAATAEGAVVFTFQSRLRGVCLPAAAGRVIDPSPP